ncbi:MAG: hypothetical protein R3Y26_09700 [Rikenellaceae bacterium]
MKNKLNAELDALLQKFVIEHVVANGGGTLSLEQLNEYIGMFEYRFKEQLKRDFGGYSSDTMSIIVSELWGGQSPVKLKKLEHDDFAEIPMFRQMELLLQIIAEKGSLKLTSTKSLPVKVVKELYEVGVEEELVKIGLQNIYKEKDSRSIMMLRAIMDLMCVVKVQKGVMTITKNGEKLMKDRQLLLEHMVKCATTNYNQGYLDFYENENIGNIGVGYSLILLSKYGDKKRSHRFYADKYFAAFPIILIEARYSNKPINGTHVYSMRTWESLFYYMGLIDYEKKGFVINEEVDIMRCPIFEKLFEIQPPQ